MDEHIDEHWRDVVGYEGIYQVSDLGRVRRIKPGSRTRPGLILKPDFDRTGYRRVILYDGSNSSQRHSLVHLLVAAAFIGPKPAGFDCNHKNGDKSDNRPQNLEYLDRKSHAAHTRNVLGLFPNNTGSRNGQAILTEAHVLEIRHLYATGNYYQRELAEMFGVVRPVINAIINFKVWKHVGGPQPPDTNLPLKPTRPGSTKLDPDQVRQIRKLAASGAMNLSELGRQFGVSGTLIGYIVQRKIWRDVL